MTSAKLVGSANKALAILTSFTLDKLERGVSELSRELGLHKATVHHILKDLERWAFVQKDEKTQKYRLGMRLLELGDLVRRNSDLIQNSQPFLDGLSRKTGGTVTLRILEKDSLLVLAKAESVHNLKITYDVGSRLPCNFGASGKLLLAFLPVGEFRRLARMGKIRRLTPRTVVNPRELEQEFERIRRRGYAFSSEQAISGARGVAAPIRDRLGNVVAALGFSMPVSLLPQNKVPEITREVLETAAAISARLGYPPQLNEERMDKGARDDGRRAAAR
ncbi:MAG: IclR family transcriptional regulator [Candidatus Tectomicrobia bacterium]|uniref:IclR family transcriptional regulator n=1 Tax=Tectimicrobiota bacterium TaxID=2528274 RepID=A0A932GQT2_UNCTE|nr:IclR family transcriptional regulator [Candidatus Tectomicrobia bacterium]